MNIFVTGATGFIGRHLVKALQHEGHMVVVNLQEGESESFPNDVETYSIGKYNLKSDFEFFEKVQFDGVLHLASLYITTHLPEDISQLIDSNIKFGTMILECASKTNVKWFLNTGTSWQNYQNEEYSPVNLYAATKQAFEDIARYYYETNSIRFCTIKLFDTFGPGDTRPKIFNLWNKIVESDESIDMSPGEQMIDITFIDDIIEAYIILINYLQDVNQEFTNGCVYALRSHNRYSLRELAKIFERVKGRKVNINWGGRQYNKREVMVPWDKGEVVPGWVPKTSIEEGILKTFVNK